MDEVVTIRGLFNGFRGRHDFSKDPVLHLSHGVVVYCAAEAVYGIPSTVILASVEGRPSSEIALDSIPLEGGQP